MSKYNAYQCDVCLSRGFELEELIAVKSIIVSFGKQSFYRLNDGHVCADCACTMDNLFKNLLEGRNIAAMEDTVATP